MTGLLYPFNEDAPYDLTKPGALENNNLVVGDKDKVKAKIAEDAKTHEGAVKDYTWGEGNFNDGLTQVTSDEAGLPSVKKEEEKTDLQKEWTVEDIENRIR